MIKEDRREDFQMTGDAVGGWRVLNAYMNSVKGPAFVWLWNA